MSILDVGCGFDPHGTVNVDITRNSNAEILASALSLPFKDNSFSLVLCSHVLEHLSDPAKAFHEISRVSRSRFVIRVPHRLGGLAKGAGGREYHRWLFRARWFFYAAKALGLRVHVNTRISPSHDLWNFPLEIVATFTKT